MGFDILGLDPEHKTGECFRNNVRYWTPLWDYIAETCKDILSTWDIEQGTCNNGYMYSMTKAVKLAERLYELLQSGKVDDWEKQYLLALQRLPDEKCPLCGGSGARDDKYAQGKCNGCKGRGTVRPSACGQVFSKDNVQAFADFAAVCGGFEIL